MSEPDPKVTPEAIARARWAGAMRNADARAVLRAILFKICEGEKPIPAEADALVLARAAARRWVAFAIRKELEAVDPRAYVVLLAEDIDESELAKQGLRAPPPVAPEAPAP